MRAIDVVGSAIGNSFRSRLRTTLTVLAIFIGAFTLTITNGLGTGINAYITDTVASIGANDVLTVTKVSADATATGPQEYSADQITSRAAAGPGSTTVAAITSTDLTTIAAIDGVTSVEPSLSATPDYVTTGSSKKYRLGLGSFVTGTTLQLSAGAQLDPASSELQIALPVSFVAPLGFASDADAIGTTVQIGITSAAGTSSVIDATVVGVSEAGLGATGNATANAALTTALYEAQSVGRSATAKDSYAQAVVHFDANASASEVTALQARFTDAGFTAKTVADQIGTFKSVIDAIVLVLNAFAVIALLAASFGIVNTLLMSVQERTREIGLMKAMGMGAGRIFGLFSIEAAFIGFLGSAIGAGIAMIVGTVVSRALSTRLFADLPGLQLISFTPASIITIILIVMGIAFLAGTLPAWRAARQDPIGSLRYE
ncbi:MULTISPECIES: ABC transporter permease [unclassified Cryobacterium]|uniref:ABC transporter permease n=1 Tax=unclassified Cryobacterium TaxID=2649013 RepID=UPI002AB52748|nr:MULTISPECIES: FtsX-like permease family protein [Cryobacterium]MDY7526443.1 FtsX-like permease family protein [Cryobacterium sp. 10C2]MDY7557750.1 FtsX-like permease family protein [Cryobacterium sp. 10C3]MEB0003613.1 FtsX-like permease family protein [Cryobacterium sp. RTC2.1]MEB0202351.1 FtsX-like permease family protein [Cryobacterium sp. 5I3]MEB0288359.1 FtsX-like permease family protein [Cryobacterium sp. 10S3]